MQRLLAAAILAATFTTAHAGPTLPEQYLGEWCRLGGNADFYLPASPDCAAADRIVIGGSGITFAAETCVLLRVITTPPRWDNQPAEPAVVWLDHRYLFGCRSPDAEPTTFLSRIGLTGDYLRMQIAAD